jgi:hypothetical protein
MLRLVRLGQHRGDAAPMSPEDFPILMNALPPKKARAFADMLPDLDRYEATGVLRKIDFAGVKEVVNRAINDAWMSGTWST